jgi:ABC-type glycerol-3-phosphate transport system substrate-binding protein
VCPKGELPRGEISFLKAPHHAQDRRFIREHIAAFAKRQRDDVSVKVSYFDWATLDADLTAAFSSDPPDLTYLVSRAWARFADAGALADMTDRVKSDRSFKAAYDAIPKPIWDAITRDGKIWGVPWLGAIFPVYVNQRLLRSAGVDDWDSSYQAMYDAAAAVRDGDVFGFTVATSMQEEAFHDLGAFIHDAGAALVNDDATRADLDHPGVAEAFDLLGRIHTEGIAPKPGIYDGEGKMALFQAGRTGFNTSGASTLVSLQEQEPPEFPWDIGLHPPGPAGRTAYGDFGFLCIAAQSSEEKQETAWELIKYLSAPNVVVPYVDQLDRNVQTVRTDVADELDRVFGKADSAAKRLYSDFLPVVQPYRSFP